jgi:type IV secretion system protein VirB10
VSESKPIESPSGLELSPKPPNPIRVSKRAGAFALVIVMLILAAFAFGGYRRQQIQQAKAADLASKGVAPATLAGSEVAKDIPSGSVPLARPAAPTSPDLVAPEDAKAAANATPSAAAAPVVVRQYPPQPAMTQYEGPQTPSPEEQERAAAYAREQQARMAPTSSRQNSASSWTPDVAVPTARLTADSTPNLASLVNSIAGGQSQNGGRQPSEYDEQNMQSRKDAFLAGNRTPPSGDYLRSTRTAPLSQFEIKAGWEIPAVLEQAINSDLPGELKALVMSNVYDTATGRYLLIPQGSRLVGLYDSHVGYGQDGVQVVWNRVIYPDGSSLDLDGMMGLDSHGYAGLRYQVDHHYKRLIGFAVLTSMFTAAYEISQNRRQSVLTTPSTGQTASAAVGQEMSQLGSQITRRNLNVQPTIKIPVGYRFNVRVNRDILFEAPYAPVRAAR